MKEMGPETSAKGDGQVVLHHWNDETRSKCMIGTNGGVTYGNSREREDALHPCDLNHVLTIMDSSHQQKWNRPEHKACHQPHFSPVSLGPRPQRRTSRGALPGSGRRFPSENTPTCLQLSERIMADGPRCKRRKQANPKRSSGKSPAVRGRRRAASSRLHRSVKSR
ncbi:hypothetical protein D4764_15G0003940 [Takifugu flavidus]|uniref:Uncharacterized protein n=1 Tax=Takifugu flavidus TaxID=433684 RepID=A0A5C6P471_9TELE|nr:hypothetical protein D4764_15G0003940 [Takifugu flavidus]